ncbi:uncharacterized protein LOC111257321 [Setaria italica]|uniref:uncharacterized protein LOC111257321 n=1 Tax=Setaria italica TaxID=4555 RepID=UPI000BE54B61|nr:uncharacterized protein LOC111257321 [Setaria italica]
MFGDWSNFRTETLTFKVVNFSGSYHAILGRPYYAKFMAITNYVYLKLKMPRPKGIIILASKIIVKVDLAEIEKNLLPTVPDSSKGTTAPAFQSDEETKEVEINSNDPTKKAHIGVTLSR